MKQKYNALIRAFFFTYTLIHGLRERERERVEVEIQCFDPCFFFTYTLIRGLREREDKAREKKKIEDGREREREKLKQNYNFKHKILALVRKVCCHKWRDTTPSQVF